MKEIIEKHILEAMNQLDQITWYLSQVNKKDLKNNRDVISQDINRMKTKLKKYLNEDFDFLARKKNTKL